MASSFCQSIGPKISWDILFLLVSLVLPNEEGEAKEEAKSGELKPAVPVVDAWYTQVAFASDKATLIEIEELEEKIFSASLQVKVSDSALEKPGK